MNSSNDHAWTQGPNGGNGFGDFAPGEDFSNFLNFENMDLSFSLLDNEGAGAAQHAPPIHSEVDNSIGFFPHSQYTLHEHGYQYNGPTQGASSQDGDPASFGHVRDQYSQQSQGAIYPDQHMPPNYSIPPTPNSADMYPHAPQFAPDVRSSQYTAQGQGQQYQPRKNDAMAELTPLVSPEMTASGSSSVSPEYTVPGAYALSPLTSPAMYPQSGSSQATNKSQSHTAESSAAASPIDLEGEVSGDFADGRPRKSRRKTQAARSTSTTTRPNITSNPSAQRKRTGASARTQRKSVTDAAPQPAEIASAPTSAQMSSAPTRENSASSISPAPTPSQNSMAPPPKPSSSTTSTPSLSSASGGLPPATPASIMRLQQKQQGAAQGQEPWLESGEISPAIGALGHGMEDLRLPDAAATPSAQSTPRISTKSTPLQLAALPSPSTKSTPSTVTSPTSDAKADKIGRNARKRNSVSKLISPALRPRISPSIAPNLPVSSRPSSAYTVSEDTHALLLASKSNYQNILEGNHLPGVNYPSELSTNLTSKRTSHKIAEQGRRNRINTALQEMQSLLPPPAVPPTDKDNPAGTDAADNSGGETSAKPPTTPGSAPLTAAAQQQAQNNSKAATVEHAIEYIRNLNGMLEEKEQENEALRQAVETLRAELGKSDEGRG